MSFLLSAHKLSRIVIAFC